ncbi:MAG: hypothetical protein NC111_07450 [Bacteroides sp.]|nr:hypothetical protein [Bacteroides sp.]MCM1472344.1 hypothetical protein [Bacteroides sp.]
MYLIWLSTKITETLRVVFSISPHVKRSPTPQRLLPLPWDKTKEHRPKADDPIISKEEALERFKQRIKKNG